MGRGRAKAKQTKVARKLKYSGPDTDFRALENELTGKGRDEDESHDHHEEPDPYDKYIDDEPDDRA